MIDNNKVSIIVPAYNVEQYIEKCIETIINQTYKNIEIIIVNDGSTDNTPKILDRIAKKDDRVIIIHKENGGVSSARNSGLDNASGDYVIFVDGDDYLAKDYVEYMLQIEEQTNADFCLSKNYYSSSCDKQISKDVIEILTNEEATTYILSPDTIVYSPNKIFKRDFLIKHNFKFSTSLFYGEGLTFMVNVAQVANRVGCGRRKVYYYRRNNALSATSKFNIRNLKNGQKALDGIEKNLKLHSKKISTMITVHKCNYCVGAMVRIRANKGLKEYYSDYKKWQKYLRKNTSKLLLKKEVRIYRKLLFVVGCICPQLLVSMDLRRRKRISEKSV